MHSEGEQRERLQVGDTQEFCFRENDPPPHFDQTDRPIKVLYDEVEKLEF
jgi:hypothetical protein